MHGFFVSRASHFETLSAFESHHYPRVCRNAAVRHTRVLIRRFFWEIRLYHFFWIGLLRSESSQYGVSIVEMIWCATRPRGSYSGGRLLKSWSVTAGHWTNSVRLKRLHSSVKKLKEGHQAVFWTAMDPMIKPPRDEPYNVKSHNGKVYQNAICRFNLNSVQGRTCLPAKEFHSIFNDSVPADCLEKVVKLQNWMKSWHQKISCTATSTAVSVSHDLFGCVNTKVEEKPVSDQVTVRFDVVFRFQQRTMKKKLETVHLEALYM